jgi:hypothetical protein
MKRWTMLGLTVCLFLIGCDEAKHPLSDPNTAKPDKRLLGVWRWEGPNKEVGYYHVGRAGDKFPAAMLRIVEIKHDQGKLEPPEEYLAFPTQLDGKSYLNVILDGTQKVVQTLDAKGWRPDAVPSYTFLKYQLDGGKLVVWLIDEEAKERAIRSGKVKGVTEANKPARFTDTPENVARFVAQAGDSLLNLDDPAHFRRIASSDQP